MKMLYLKIMSRILAAYLFLLPISMIGIERPSKAIIVVGAVSFFYLITCSVADGNREDESD